MNKDDFGNIPKRGLLMYVMKILTAIYMVVSGVLSGAAETEPELFRIAPEDEGTITKEFIAAMRAEVGDEKASYASDELDDFANTWIANGKTRQEYESRKCDYLNYLERLYDKALRAASQGLSAETRAELLRKEEEWKKYGCTDYDYSICDSSGKPFIGIDPRDRYIRLCLNRTRYLECSAERRAELDRFQGLRVPYRYAPQKDSLPIEYNELRRVTPLSPFLEDKQLWGKTYVEDIATLPPEFCREAKAGGDVYQMGILIPNNDHVCERSAQGYERVLVVWKNRKHHAHYYLPHHALVQNVTVHGTQVSVRYLQVDDFVDGARLKKQVEQTFAIDFTYRIYAPVKITNWLDYWIDGFGNLHVDECCEGKFEKTID